MSFRHTAWITGSRKPSWKPTRLRLSLAAALWCASAMSVLAEPAHALPITTVQLGSIEPQGIAVSADQTVYVADLGGGKVYSIAPLGPPRLTPVYTGPKGSDTALSTPSALAINAEGDLFVADFDLARIIVVPTRAARAPFVLDTHGLLRHPISLALDASGNLFIGDAGAAGNGATGSNPGFVVESPSQGSPFRLPIHGASIVFPQALAVNPGNSDLLIGDGGEVSGHIVDVKPGGAATTLSTPNPEALTNPTALSVDAAGNLYVADGTSNAITVISPDGADAVLTTGVPSALSSPSSLARFPKFPGSASFVVANLSGGSSNNLVFLDSESMMLAHRNRPGSGGRSSQTAAFVNTANRPSSLGAYAGPGLQSGFAPTESTACAGVETSVPAASDPCVSDPEFSPAVPQTASEALALPENIYDNEIPFPGQTRVVDAGQSKGSVPVPQPQPAGGAGKSLLSSIWSRVRRAF